MVPGPNRTVWLALFAVLFGHVTLVSIPTEGRAGTIIRTLILDGLTPIERLVDVSIHGVAAIWTNYFDLIDTRRENQDLRAQNAELRMEIARNRSEVSEAERLRRFFDLSPLMSGDRVAARVIGRDATLSRQTITIDKGTSGGLHVDAAVVTPDGVVGRVIHAAHWSAIVQLITDPDSAVGVTVGESRVQGIVQGAGGGGLRLEHVDDTRELHAGDRLVTSGTDQIYPKGLPLGEVVALGPVQNLMRTAEVRPSADLGRLEEVLCLINAAGSTLLLDSTSDGAGTP